MSELIEVHQVARLLKVCKRTVYRLVDRKILPAGRKIGRNRRWNVDEIEKAVRLMPK